MAKKNVMSEAGDAMRTVAGAALGAAAIAATGVVVAKLSGAIRQGGKDLEDAAPRLQKMAADTVTKPILPARQKRVGCDPDRQIDAPQGRGQEGGQEGRQSNRQAPEDVRARKKR